MSRKKTKERPYQILGENVRRWRHIRGLTQRQLSYSIGRSSSYLVWIEAGEIRAPIHRYMEIAEALSVPFSILYHGAFEKPRPIATQKKRKTAQ